jgi:hypothetical protein
VLLETGGKSWEVGEGVRRLSRRPDRFEEGGGGDLEDCNVSVSCKWREQIIDNVRKSYQPELQSLTAVLVQREMLVFADIGDIQSSVVWSVF